ncbi:rhamnosyltransferase [Deinococcus enclensis]|uniref:Rhamnosyltransferase n=2 Tax=Deinococcus enclensis TaxID=1049582 RepID=A0ABT9MBX4_9DEIO|nr:rhamnosyltransferase [Deinococcus enclensis]
MRFAEYFSCNYESLDQSKFNHGGTRNLGARLASEQGAQILVFMTQDALPADEHWLKRLVAPIRSGQAVATFARQLPRPEASLLERFSRYFNYPEVSRSRTEADIPELGVKAFFFSNVCSAVRADVFWEVGGFPEDVIMNEDMTLAAKLLRAGHTVRYTAEAEVIHSHDYTLAQQFRRNFDVGAFFADAGPELSGASVGGEGVRFVLEQLRYVRRHGRSDLIPLVIAEAAAKYTAFQLGRHHHLLPLPLKKKLSMHSYHWDQRRAPEEKTR